MTGARGARRQHAIHETTSKWLEYRHGFPSVAGRTPSGKESILEDSVVGVWDGIWRGVDYCGVAMTQDQVFDGASILTFSLRDFWICPSSCELVPRSMERGEISEDHLRWDEEMK